MSTPLLDGATDTGATDAGGDEGSAGSGAWQAANSRPAVSAAVHKPHGRFFIVRPPKIDVGDYRCRR
ncbi:hypothetical protein L3i22_037420 [Actinoplanes sp. L3-i22]|nr:hypothetical protein L3i22_037420 [Actinoplanes sp. L3-i22]